MPSSTERRYSIHKIFGPTIQGEGQLSGVQCIFVRFSGCNRWNGKPEDRAASECPFCDTDFYSHTMMTAGQILAEIRGIGAVNVEWIWISGGEPMLQLDMALVEALRKAGYKIAVETNGSIVPTPPIMEINMDHVTVSPKQPPAGTRLRRAHTLKLLYPHPNPFITPEAFNDFPAEVRYLQPIADDDPEVTTANLQAAVEKIYQLKGWRLSYQLHKILEVE